jgi:hypothetical protein
MMVGELVAVCVLSLYRQFGTSAICNKSFTLSYIIPDKSNQVKTYTFVSAKDFRASFSGFLFTNLMLKPQSCWEMKVICC